MNKKLINIITIIIAILALYYFGSYLFKIQFNMFVAFALTSMFFIIYLAIKIIYHEDPKQIFYEFEYQTKDYPDKNRDIMLIIYIIFINIIVWNMNLIFNLSFGIGDYISRITVGIISIGMLLFGKNIKIKIKLTDIGISSNGGIIPWTDIKSYYIKDNWIVFQKFPFLKIPYINQKQLQIINKYVKPKQINKEKQN